MEGKPFLKEIRPVHVFLTTQKTRVRTLLLISIISIINYDNI